MGERLRYKVCNLDPCPENEPTFRAQQCSKFNNETYRDKTYKWLPYFDSREYHRRYSIIKKKCYRELFCTDDPCELYCTDSEDTLIVPWGDSAADGTPCNIGKNDMCISGICRVSLRLHANEYDFKLNRKLQRVGCDWIVDSNTMEDQCGICGGNGETCTTIRDEFNKKMNNSEDYFEITQIPSGSRQILIEEIHPSKNYLCIDKADSNETFLNGHHLILMPGEFSVGKAMGLYERDNEQERIKVPGPIPFDISIKVPITKIYSLEYDP